MADKPLVGIIMGSKSDMPAMEACTAQLDELGVPYELVVASAHRAPQKVHDWASTAADRGLKVIIAAAGKAAHLGGVVAAYTPLPIVGVPMKTSLIPRPPLPRRRRRTGFPAYRRHRPEALPWRTAGRQTFRQSLPPC